MTSTKGNRRSITGVIAPTSTSAAICASWLPRQRDEHAARLQHPDRPRRRFGILAGKEEFVACKPRAEILRLIGDNDIRPKPAHQIGACAAGGRGDGRAKMLGKLDRNHTNAA
ncbi:hypothetical protein [Novosphingobium sp. Leaf2]|uniref:hypothetical protein n=1 Tax=Novosphingobium sp. Leaf2 TaxID=1735670 RepID=UPI000AAFDADE|nr:hypothetical protein [Novosphingobium sp. Leaf2]